MINRMIISNITGGVDNGLPIFVKAFFEATFSFSDILKITFSTLNHVNHVRRFTTNMRFVTRCHLPRSLTNGRRLICVSTSSSTSLSSGQVKVAPPIALYMEDITTPIKRSN